MTERYIKYLRVGESYVNTLNDSDIKEIVSNPKGDLKLKCTIKEARRLVAFQYEDKLRCEEAQKAAETRRRLNDN